MGLGYSCNGLRYTPGYLTEVDANNTLDTGLTKQDFTLNTQYRIVSYSYRKRREQHSSE